MLEAHHHHQYQYRPLAICLLAGLSFITVCRLRMGTSAGGLTTPDGLEAGGLSIREAESLGPVVGPYQPLVASNVSTSPMPFDVAEGALGVADRSQLVDLGNFSFLMNDAAANVCQGGAANSTPMVVTLVHSSPAHQHHREAIRQVWGEHMNVVFLVGETADNATQQQQLEAENELYGDIVQGSFRDAYRNLTYKHVMGLKWVAYHCPRARYIIKTDDDVFVNTRNLLRFLNERLSPLGVRRLIMCQLWKDSFVKRSYRSKWRVSPEEYAGRFYPGYCPGWAVIYSPDVVLLLYREAQRTPFFWIDDVHVTGTLVAAANLTHTPLGNEPYLWADDRDVMRRHHNSFLFYLMDQQQFKDLHQVQHSLPFS